MTQETAEQRFAAEVQRQERIARGEEPLSDAMIRAGVQRVAPTPAQPARPTLQEQANRVADFDYELQQKGLQQPNVARGVVDQRAVDHLNNLKQTTPREKQTAQWQAIWERDMGEVLAGRRYGETPEQFAPRAAASRLAALDAEAAAQFKGWSTAQKSAWADRRHAAEEDARRLGVQLDDDGQVIAASSGESVLVASDHFTVAEHGYTLPSLPPGISLERDETAAMLATAKAAGFTQAQVNSYFAAMLKQVEA